MESTEIRIFEYSSKRMSRWEKKMKPLHCKTVSDAYCGKYSFITMKMESSFTTFIRSRGWHVFQQSTWKNPKKHEALSFKKETDPVALRFDPFSIAFPRKSIEYLTPLTVGHIYLWKFQDLFTSFGREVEKWRQRYIEQSVSNLHFQRAA